MQPVPRDGETLGEVMMRGNVVMKGYLKNPDIARDKAFAGGWFHTGDLGVMHPDGYIQLKDRSKDIIISGGENISSIEVEDALYKHPAVQAVAVVAKPDDKWGETPCAFIELKPGQSATADELIAWCKKNLAGYKVPRTIVFEELPKTSTGKIQKFKLRDRAKAVIEAVVSTERGDHRRLAVLDIVFVDEGDTFDQRLRDLGQPPLKSVQPAISMTSVSPGLRWKRDMPSPSSR